MKPTYDELLQLCKRTRKAIRDAQREGKLPVHSEPWLGLETALGTTLARVEANPNDR